MTRTTQPKGEKMSRRDEYIEQIKTQLDAWNKQIDKLQERATIAQGDAEASLRDRMQAMREQLNQAKSKLNELQTVGADRWEATQSEMENLRGALVSSFNYFKSQV
jgi:chromosome segregation ATPase